MFVLRQILGLLGPHRAAVLRHPVVRWGLLLTSVGTVLCLSACGQKGPLYLPAPNTTASATTVLPASTPHSSIQP